MSKGYKAVAAVFVAGLISSAAPSSAQTPSSEPPPANQVSMFESATRRMGETATELIAISPKSDGKSRADASQREPAKDIPATWFSSIKKFFKDFRAGSCPAAASRAPSSSWPARGEAAITVCQS